MSKITYKDAAKSRIFVYLEGKRVGTIYPIYGGVETHYQYSTLRGNHGDIFYALADCKRSLEGDK